jgi:hypothetical protein
MGQRRRGLRSKKIKNKWIVMGPHTHTHTHTHRIIDFKLALWFAQLGPFTQPPPPHSTLYNSPPLPPNPSQHPQGTSISRIQVAIALSLSLYISKISCFVIKRWCRK